MDKNQLYIIGAVVVSSVTILGVILGLDSKNASPPLNSSEGNASVEVVGEQSHNWGDIDIMGGKVEKTFEIKNSGDGDLEIANIVTSCMCTEAQVEILEEKSPVFGMHTRSSWKGVIKSGEVAKIRVVFDPLFHGPEAVGPITRIVAIDTNDKNNKKLELRLSGNVVKL